MQTQTVAADRMTGLDVLEAVQQVWNIIRGESAEASEFEAQQINGLIRDLRPYSDHFRLSVIRTRLRNRQPFVSVNVYGDDPGCVNNNARPLATAWLETLGANNGGFFYYEA